MTALSYQTTHRCAILPRRLESGDREASNLSGTLVDADAVETLESVKLCETVWEAGSSRRTSAWPCGASGTFPACRTYHTRDICASSDASSPSVWGCVLSGSARPRSTCNRSYIGTVCLSCENGCAIAGLTAG